MSLPTASRRQNGFCRIEQLEQIEDDDQPIAELKAYMLAGGPWTGTDAQLQTKAAGLIKLIVGSSEYQLV